MTDRTSAPSPFSGPSEGHGLPPWPKDRSFAWLVAVPVFVVAILVVAMFPGFVATPATIPVLLPAVTPVDDQALVTKWMREQQFTDPTQPKSFGAVRVHHNAGYRFDGVDYFQVVPYSANLGLTGYLASGAEDRLDIVERWIDWYLGHANLTRTPPGVVLNHWYRVGGTGETTCPPASPAHYCDYEDASDSYAATFLRLVDAYRMEAGPRANEFLLPREVALERVGSVILFLQDEDGLTWARDDYHVKYTMDNSESYAGLVAMANLQEEVFGNATEAARYEDAAARLQAGLQAHLFDPLQDRYRVAYHPNGQSDSANLLAWYPYTVPIAWPHLFDAIDPAGPQAASQMGQLNDAWSGPLRDWTRTTADSTGFLWPSIGHAALLAGDTSRAQTHTNFVKCQRFPYEAASNFAWPWSVDDAGWLLSTFAAGIKPTNPTGACP